MTRGPTTARARRPPQYFSRTLEQVRRATRAVDQINAKLGRDAVRFAASGLKREWMTRCEKRPPRYITNWKELLCVT